MQGQHKYEIILKSEIFLIPSHFEYLKDVNPEIYLSLKTTQKYKVRSSICNKTMQLFINHWVYNEIPDINLNNILEFELLSKEFDRMRNIIQLSKQYFQKAIHSFFINQKNNYNHQLQEKEDKSKQQTTKYQQIIFNIFFNNKISSYSSFKKIKKKLFEACKNGDIDFLLLLIQNEIIENDGLLYILNENKKEALLFRANTTKKEIKIPKSINNGSNEYIVTHILRKSFKNSKNIKSIQFSEDSQILSIEKNAFINCSLESITIPSSVEVLEEGWCKETPNLINVKIIQNKKANISHFDDSFIIGKSDLNSANYDVLLFAPRNIRHAKIPSFIKRISDYAFHECAELQSIEFSNDSQLISIGAHSFSNSSITSILVRRPEAEK